jgi:SAM-dependent methyltransferase
MTSATDLNEYATAEHALKYLSRADGIPHRTEGEAVLLEFIPQHVERILDLGTGDGRLLALVRIGRRNAAGVALDFSPTMLAAARERFRNDHMVRVVDHNLDNPLPDLGRFDVIVSSFAIHHCTDERKRTLYTEIYAALTPGGVFCNLEHVAPPSAGIHARFLRALGIT